MCEMRDEAHEKAENKSDSSVRNGINDDINHKNDKVVLAAK